MHAGDPERAGFRRSPGRRQAETAGLWASKSEGEEAVAVVAEERALTGVVASGKDLLARRCPHGKGEAANDVVQEGGAPAEPCGPSGWLSRLAGRGGEFSGRQPGRRDCQDAHPPQGNRTDRYSREVCKSNASSGRTPKRFPPRAICWLFQEKRRPADCAGWAARANS